VDIVENEDAFANKNTIEREDVSENDGTAEHENVSEDEDTAEHENLSVDENTAEHEDVSEDEDRAEHENVSVDENTSESEEVIGAIPELQQTSEGIQDALQYKIEDSPLMGCIFVQAPSQLEQQANQELRFKVGHELSLNFPHIPLELT
jgi:hypothetical protein